MPVFYDLEDNRTFNYKIRPRLDEIQDMFMINGYTIQDVCKVINVPRNTFYKIMEISPEFKNWVHEARLMQRHEIKKSILKSATGFTVEETEEEAVYNEDGEIINGLVKRKVRTRYIPASASMQIFLAKNFWPNQYQDVKPQNMMPVPDNTGRILTLVEGGAIGEKHSNEEIQNEIEEVISEGGEFGDDTDE